MDEKMAFFWVNPLKEPKNEWIGELADEIEESICDRVNAKTYVTVVTTFGRDDEAGDAIHEAIKPAIRRARA